MSNDKQITGNIGVFHVARELSRVGWNVILSVRNARGADMFAVSEDEHTVHPIQVKSHAAKPLDTSLGLQPAKLVTPWWVFVTSARCPEPVCYVMKLEEVRSGMRPDPGTRSGKAELERVFWLDRRYYTPGSDREMIDARNAWNRLGPARTTIALT